MAHYPHWLPKLQEEIDAVCGDRMPELEDVPNMPRLRATCKEMLRWRQSTPLGVPHVTLEDDVYNGYHIPKGAICHANNFLISREPKQFPKGDQFIPERWLDPAYPTYKEPLTEFPNLRGDFAFGYGNRACPGTDLTSLELFTLYGALASCFDIKAPEGTEHIPWYEVHPYVITMTKPFPMDIKPRSEAKAKLIMEMCPDDAGYTLMGKSRLFIKCSIKIGTLANIDIYRNQEDPLGLDLHGWRKAVRLGRTHHTVREASEAKSLP